MKNTLLIISVISAFNLNISLSQWTVQTLPIASGRSLSMDFSDQDHGIVCGGFTDFGSQARASYSTNGGADRRSAVSILLRRLFY